MNDILSSNNGLARIFTAQHVDERLWHILEPIRDGFKILQFSFDDPVLHCGDAFGPTINPAINYETLHGQLLHVQEWLQNSRFWQISYFVHVVVRGYRATNSDTTIHIHFRYNQRAQFTANIVKVTVNAVRSSRFQLFFQIVAVVVDYVVEANFLFQPIGLLVRTGEANHLAAFDFGDLTNERTNGTRCTGHGHHFTTLWLADLQEAKVSGIAEKEENNFQTL